MAYRKRNEIEENLLKNESNQKRLIERDGVNIIKSLDCLLALSEGSIPRETMLCIKMDFLLGPNLALNCPF